jgi:ubiquinone biosynthesis protein UbiJ
MLNPLPHAATHFINHLLSQAPWAQQSLRSHGGKTAIIDAGALVLRLRVTKDGLLEPADDADKIAADNAADVTITLQLADLPLIASNPERAFSYVKISGDADFANAISTLSRGLRWDAGHELSKFIGEIAAQRMVSAAGLVAATVQATYKSLTGNIAEYFLDEQPILMRPAAIGEFGGAVVKLRDDVERLAKRLEKLEGKR